MTDEWVCCICGKKTDVPHEHDLKELIDGFKDETLQNNIEKYGLPAEQIALKGRYV